MSRLEKGWGDILHNPLAYIGYVQARLPLQALDTSGVDFGGEKYCSAEKYPKKSETILKLLI